MRDALSESLYTLLDHLNRQWSQPPMNILEVIRNEFLHDLKGDHIAVDARGTPIARAADRAAVERAAPNAAAYFSGADFGETDATRVEVTVPVTTGVAAVTPTPIISTPPEFFPAPADTIGATDSATAPPEPYPTYVPASQPPQDNEPVEPDAEQFPEPTVPATDPAKLN